LKDILGVIQCLPRLLVDGAESVSELAGYVIKAHEAAASLLVANCNDEVQLGSSSGPVVIMAPINLPMPIMG
jgi:hypothetical protein